MAYLPPPKALHHTVIQNISRDLITYVLNTNSGTISGEALHFIYYELHGIASHGFEPDGIYQIHFRENKYALVLKTGVIKSAA
jgi:hypothetical protein